MKNLLILGAGTAGTMVANTMARRLPRDWRITIIDPDAQHLYQPGLLFLPFGIYDESQLFRPRARTLARRVQWQTEKVAAVDAHAREVALASGAKVPYDLLVIATGASVRREETEGLTDASIHDFYTFDGARKLRDALATFRGGRLLVNVVENPIKCPVAPLEFLFLADDFFRRKGIRNDIELVYATPLDGPFTKPVCSKVLKYLFDGRGIRVETEFNTGRVDSAKRVLESWDERTIDYDLLVTIPIHQGASFLRESGIAGSSTFVPADRNTLRVKDQERIFALGDVTDLPVSKAGSVAHFQAEVLTENLMRTIAGRELDAGFDGHANCFIETGNGKAILIDFNYDLEPVPGKYPLPVVGPMSLLRESRINHFGKLAFRWIYWNALLPGRHIPVSNRMSMKGKEIPWAQQRTQDATSN
jgi:sulfide:quinone oxidoreductase